MIRKTIFLLLCLGCLSACERTPEPVAQQSVPAPQAAAEPAKAEPVPALKVVDEKPAASPAKPSVAARPKPAATPSSKPALPESKLALDLSVPQELFEQALESETQEEISPLLPPLFGEKPEDVSPFQISGKLINNARVDDYWDSIEGAELQFEFKQ